MVWRLFYRFDRPKRLVLVQDWAKLKRCEFALVKNRWRCATITPAPGLEPGAFAERSGKATDWPHRELYCLTSPGWIGPKCNPPPHPTHPPEKRTAALKLALIGPSDPCGPTGHRRRESARAEGPSRGEFRISGLTHLMIVAPYNCHIGTALISPPRLAEVRIRSSRSGYVDAHRIALARSVGLKFTALQ